MMLGVLIPCGGGDTIPLTRSKLLVGRRSQCDICLRFKTVSSHHCELELRDGYWHIRDLGSSNGVKVNGMRVESESLMPGDEVMIARQAFNIDYNLDATAASSESENPFSMSLMQKAGLEVSREERKSRAGRRTKSRTKQRTSPKDEFMMEWLDDDA